ncbi:MAG: glycosyltransferase, partial [Vicinamibacterales bacterium]
MKRHVVVMVTSSYPRFPGDAVGTFMEPIAHGVAARGHEVHIVAPWHPLVARKAREGGVLFHFYRYAPHSRLNVFGYAGALRADVALKGSALLAAPFALAAGLLAARRVARRYGATVMHGHWVVPGGATAWAARTDLPLVVSLHGSDVYVAERHVAARLVARRVFAAAGWVTACSDDLLRRARHLGAASETSEVVPYGVDAQRFAPDEGAPRALRTRFGLADEPIVVAVGRMVRKKGFDYLLDAIARLTATGRHLRLILAGGGDLEKALRERADASGAAPFVTFAGTVPHHEIPQLL